MRVDLSASNLKIATNPLASYQIWKAKKVVEQVIKNRANDLKMMTF